MIFILLNWATLAYISFHQGIFLRKFIGLETSYQDVAIAIIYGLFSISILSTIWLFVFPGNDFLLGALIVLSAVTHLFRRKKNPAANSVGQPLNLSKLHYATIVLVAFGCLIACLNPSALPDDDLYYKQTVIWLKGSGFVHGVSNLNLPVGLASAWHIVQSASAFSWIEVSVANDLNGFIVVVFSLYCCTRQKDETTTFLSVVFLLVLAISIPFLSACAPDLPVIILTVIAVDRVVINDRGRGNDLLILAAFAITIKLSAIAIFALPFIDASLHRKAYIFSGRWKNTLSILVFAFVLMFAKNVYQTGYPIYPFTDFGFEKLPWTTPEKIVLLYEQGLKAWAFSDVHTITELDDYKSFRLSHQFILLLTREGYKGIVNSLSLIALVVLIAMAIRQRLSGVSHRNFRLTILLVVVLSFNVIVWFIYAPQSRFIMPILIVAAAYIIASFPFTRKLFLRPQRAIFLAGVILFSAMPLVLMTSRFRSPSQFLSINIVSPAPQLPLQIEVVNISGSSYNRPTNTIYCAGSPVPCYSLIQQRILDSAGPFKPIRLDGSDSPGYALKK